MANKRMIAADIWRDDFVCTLDYFERLLWIGMIVTCADDQGRIQDRAGFIGGDVFPGESVSTEKVEASLTSFEKEGKIFRYQDGKTKLIQIVNWWEYQQPSWAMPSKYPAPNGWTDRIKMHVKDSKDVTVIHWKEDGGFSEEIRSALRSGLHSSQDSALPSGIDEMRLNEISRDEKRVVESAQKQREKAQSPSPDQAWNTVKGQLADDMNPADYRSWIENVKPCEFQDDTFKISTVNKYAADWITKRAGEVIKRSLAGIYGRPVSLNVIVDANHIQH